MDESLVVLLLAFAVALGVPLIARPDVRPRLVAFLRRVRPWQWLLVAVVLLGLVVRQPPFLIVAAFAMAVILFGLEWRREFRFLMGLEDEAFRGRNDKLIWAFLLIVLPPVGVWLFRSHRMAEWPEAETAKKVGGFEEL